MGGDGFFRIDGLLCSDDAARDDKDGDGCLLGRCLMSAAIFFHFVLY
jgi:hypothetical protein